MSKNVPQNLQYSNLFAQPSKSVPPIDGPYLSKNNEQHENPEDLSSAYNLMEDDVVLIDEQPNNHCCWGFITTRWSKGVEFVRNNRQLLMIKLVLVLYAMQYSMTGSITNQLWIDRTCSIKMGFNKTVCSQLTNTRYRDFENAVQKQVAVYNTISIYLSKGPPILMSLYLGPVSEKGRKILMYIPYMGHVVSGSLTLLVVFFDDWPPETIWLSHIYVIFGGYVVLQIAMYSYIGDVTSEQSRTSVMTILAGLGVIVFQLADFIGGQLFKAFGYFGVYGASLAISVCGLFYVCFVPETVVRKVDANTTAIVRDQTHPGIWRRVWNVFVAGNRSIVDLYRCLIKPRDDNQRQVILASLFICMFINGAFVVMLSNGLLFTERVFGWSVVDYTNYVAFLASVYFIRSVLVTPFYSSLLKMHDCLVAITGCLSSSAMLIITGLSTKSWMMYIGAFVWILGGIESSPIQSLLTKCTSPDEYGKIFALWGCLISLVDMIAGVVQLKIYQQTVDTFPGATYFFALGFEVIAIVCILFLYFVGLRKLEGLASRRTVLHENVVEVDVIPENSN